MGLLGKVLGLEKKGKISMAVDKPSYIAGELVVGTIHVEVFEPIECNAVVLKATGKEKFRWDELLQDFPYSQEKEFFKDVIVISSIPHTYMPGSYSYPFEYQLPPDLPGVFEIDYYTNGKIMGLKGRIGYKLKATLDVNGFLAKDLKANCVLTVHEQLSHLVQPSHDSISQPVKRLWTFNKGNCDIDAVMDKNAYMAGETAHILCKINNRSKVDVSEINTRLMQVLELHVYGGTQVLTRELCLQTFPGVAAGSVLEQPQALPLVPNTDSQPHTAIISPSTNGRILKCSYYVEIECDISWCPDVRVTLPLTVIAPMVVMAPVPMATPMP